MEITKVISTVLGAIASIAQKPAQRNSLVIKTLKACDLDPDHPPAEFSGVYNYALVEYALADEDGKPEALLKLLSEKEVRKAFRQAFDAWDRTPLNKALDERLNWSGADNEWNFVSNAIREQGIDVQREVSLFFAVFVQVVRRSQTPKEQLQTLLLSDVLKDIQRIKAQLAQVSDLSAISEQLGPMIAGQVQALLPVAVAQTSGVVGSLADQLADWFEVLGYGTEEYRVDEETFFECVITIPVRRKRYDRIVVRGVEGEAGLSDLRALQESVAAQKADEGWLVSNMRVSSGARKAVAEEAQCEDISCYTLDELLDEDADFSGYIEWLEKEITSRRIDQDYISLGCSKEEIDPKTKVPLGMSHYGEEEGWIEGYVDQWLADSSKEHLSVLGEFGTGKTWFVMHYAWLALQKYKAAKTKGVVRPRLPLVVPLRDYAKAVSMESLFSEFFFRKHEIPLPGYTAFEQLNKMGKLLLIFDGFDEMAARIDLQAMIDNFWELARVVVPGAKAILTCRTEHFPDAIYGRETFGAQKKASTAKLTGEPPQFEVLELAKFEDEQIAALLWNQVQRIAAKEQREPREETVQEVLGNPQLLDLARRPVMVELILDALPEIEAGKRVDMARVYLYAVTRKMDKDIKNERTFNSLADKLYFLCELSWEMLSTDQMSLNYRAFPDKLQQMFADRVKEDKELDHWRFDMMGQTMLIRNSEGDYSPAHRSLLEFFVAYKIVASLGAMAADFTAVAQQQSHLDESLPKKGYTWNSYFKRDCDESGEPLMMLGLNRFEQMGMDELLPLLSEKKLAKAVLDLAHPMLNQTAIRAQLLPLLQKTAQRTIREVGYLGGNVAQLMLAKSAYALTDSNLQGIKLRGADLTDSFLRRVNLGKAQLTETVFSKVLSSVYAVEYSPQGNYLAVGDRKGILQVWDVSTRHVVMLCQAHTGSINSIVFNLEGKQLATGSDDSTVKIWNLKSGTCVYTLEGHQDRVSSVAYSPNGLQLATGSFDSTVKLWNPASGICGLTLDGYKNRVISLAYRPDGTQLAVGCYNRDVKIWNPTNGDFIRVLDGYGDRVTSVAYSRDGRQLATSSAMTIKLWNSMSWDCTHTLEGHSNKVTSIVYSPDNQQLVTGSYDHTVKIWDLKSGLCIRTLEDHSGGVISVACSEDGRQIAAGSSNSEVKLWDRVSGGCIGNLKGHENFILSTVYSPNGQHVLTGSADQTVKLWNSTTGECIRVLEGHKDRVRSIAYSPNGNQIASGSYDKTIKLWCPETATCIATLRGHTKGVRSVAYSPDGNQIASASADAAVKLWNPLTGKCTQTLYGHTNVVRSVAYSPSGQQVASGSHDQTIKLWDLESGNCTNTLEGHKSGIRSVTYSPDMQHVASGSYDNTIRLWNVKTGHCISILEGHTDGIRSIAYNPNGQQIATCSYDKTIRLWTAAGMCTLVLRGHFDGIRSIAYSPDGTQLVSGSYDNTIRIWEVRTGACISVIDDRVYAGLDITDVVGLTAGQRTSLELMGAVNFKDT